jgi:hypothetical protein
LRARCISPVCISTQSIVHNRTLRRRPTGIIVHGDTRYLEDAVTCRRPHTKPRIPITPVVPDPQARRTWHVGRENTRLHTIKIEDRLTRQPIYAVLVQSGLCVGRGRHECGSFSGRPVGIEEVLGVGGVLGGRGGGGEVFVVNFLEVATGSGAVEEIACLGLAVSDRGPNGG